MNLQIVPEWGGGNGRDSLDGILGAVESISPSKGRWHNGQPTRRCDLGSVPDRDFEELCWEDGQLLVVMQGLGAASNPKSNPQTQKGADQFVPMDDEILLVRSDLAGGDDDDHHHDHDHDHDHIFVGRPNNEALIDPLNANPNPQEDELLAWLQYPFDEPSEISLTDDGGNARPPFGRLSSSSSVSHDDAYKGARLMNPDGVAGLASSSSTVRWNSTFLPMPPPSVTPMQKNLICSSSCNSSYGDEACGNGDMDLARREFSLKSNIEVIDEGQTPTVSAEISTLSNRAMSNTTSMLGNSSMNFSNFARPAATFKASLQSLGVSSGPTGAERLKHLDQMSTFDASKPELVNSTRKRICEPQIVADPVDGVSASIVHDHSSFHLSTWNESNNNAPFHEKLDGRSELIVRGNGEDSSIISDVGAPSVVECVETSDISSCNGSEFNPDDKIGSSRRKACDEISNIPSKVLENETTVCIEKREGGAAGEGNINKKRRIAESHNRSERRRRDRISEKMKALQSLVPNSHKSNKASMLEAAITYIKALKAQIEIMSCSSGDNSNNAYFLSPMLVPQGMQPVAVAAWPTSMGMGMTMGNMGICTPTCATAATTTTTTTTTTTSTTITGRQYPPLRPTPSIHAATKTADISRTSISLGKFNLSTHAVVPPMYRMIIPATAHGSMAACNNPFPTQSLMGFQPIQRLQPVPVSARGVYDHGLPHAR